MKLDDGNLRRRVNYTHNGLLRRRPYFYRKASAPSVAILRDSANMLAPQAKTTLLTTPMTGSCAAGLTSTILRAQGPVMGVVKLSKLSRKIETEGACAFLYI